MKPHLQSVVSSPERQQEQIELYIALYCIVI